MNYVSMKEDISKMQNGCLREKCSNIADIMEEQNHRMEEWHTELCELIDYIDHSESGNVHNINRRIERTSLAHKEGIIAHNGTMVSLVTDLSNTLSKVDSIDKYDGDIVIDLIDVVYKQLSTDEETLSTIGTIERLIGR